MTQTHLSVSNHNRVTITKLSHDTDNTQIIINRQCQFCWCDTTQIIITKQCQVSSFSCRSVFTFTVLRHVTSSTTISSATAPPGRVAICKRLITNLYPTSTNIHSAWLQLLLSTADSSLFQVQPQKLLHKYVHNYQISGNKMPTRCNRWFLLQILLRAQHVSGTNWTHNPQLHTIPTTWKPKHQIRQAATTCMILSSSWWWA
jgi:hypothetical protein